MAPRTAPPRAVAPPPAPLPMAPPREAASAAGVGAAPDEGAWRAAAAWPSSTACSSGAARVQAPASTATAGEAAGDYAWRSEDGQVEALLRLRENGQWWHAVHRQARERGRVVHRGESQPEPNRQEENNVWRAYKDFSRGATDSASDEAQRRRFFGEYEDVSVWEIVEALGCWQQVEPAQGCAPETSGALLLTCDSWHIRSSHPSAPAVFRPTEEGRKEIDAMMEAGQLLLCYVLGDAGAGTRSLELQAHFEAAPPQAAVPSVPRGVGQPPARRPPRRGLQLAFQALGFARRYQRGAAGHPLAAG
ncbi:unnamed protein product [Prorocentrum cordatum]|uniref:Uncharacterized protein n=1 Tax=Prorocentrum cordatum TaxID=2364126 RepID=A0ABN9TFX3_9DINO|nr:unnamed protein product [Polarella glacialis]